MKYTTEQILSMVIRPEDGCGFVACDSTRGLENGGTESRMGRYRMAELSDGYLRVGWNSCNERIMISYAPSHMIMK